MPFQYTLANLLAEDPNTLAVMFVDDAGETVELASAEYGPFDVQVVAAYLGIYMRQTDAASVAAGLGSPSSLHIRHQAVDLHLESLPDGYYLVLAQRRPALAARARRSLEKAAAELTRELFP
jgi:hypothetical protein